jgi:CheY-like chemotaxis protein
VAGIVGQSGGWVEVATALGQGSTFTIYLPLANPQPSEAPLEDATLRRSAPTQERTGPAPVVLVVDDDPVVRTACSRLLLGLGYGVLEQHSPEAALALSDEALRRVSVILTDIVMPGMDGTSMAHRLRERLPELPVLFMSGHTPDPRAHDHLAEPGVAFLAKPFTRGALDAAIRQLLEA